MKEESKKVAVDTQASNQNRKDQGGGGGGGKGSGPPVFEEQKTAYEKFEDNVREIIFNVLYVLLKNEEHSKGDTTIEVVLDMIQIYSFTFSSNAAFPWKQDNIMYYFEWCFNIVQISTLFNYIDYTTFLVIFYVSIMIVILVILDIFYVSYSFQQKKFKYVWPLKLLRSVCGLMVTVFFLNFLELFCSFLQCVPDETNPNKMVMNLYSEVECYSGLFNLHSSFAVAVSFVFVIICLIAALALFETKESPNDVCAKVSSRPDFVVLVVKLLILYMFSFFYQQQYHWFVISATFIMSLIIYKGYRDNWPYYSDYMNRLMSLVTGLFVWGNFVLIIVKLLSQTDFDGGLQIYFLGLPLVGLMIVFGKDERVQLLNKNINNFQRGEDMALQIRYFLNLVQTRETDRRNAIILRGYIYHHEDSCSYSECCLAQYKKLMKQTITEKNISSSGKDGKALHDKRSHKGEMQKLLLQHAKSMYRAAMRKFPSCTALRIQYAFFLLNHMRRKQEAIVELTNAKQFSPSFEEQFIIFRYLKMSEDYDDVGEANGSGNQAAGGEEMDVVAKFAYESSLRQFQENILQSAQYHAEFWSYLKGDRPDMNQLNDCGSRINKSVVLVEQFWDQLQKLSPNQPQVMKTYARYLTQVLNDTQRGQLLMARAKEATSGKQNYLDADGSDYQDLSRNGSPCIVVSGNLYDVGRIVRVNQGACRIFGYSQNELIGQDVEKLMPPIYAKHHTKILRSAIQREPEKITTKERFVFAMHKSGYIFPVTLQLKFIQTRVNGDQRDDEDGEFSGQFVSIFKIDKKLMSSNIGFLLIDKERKIQAISSSCITMLYMDNNRLKRLYNTHVNIDSFSPEIFNNIPQLPNNDMAFEQQSYPIQWSYACDLERSQSSNISKQKSVTSSDNASILIKLKSLKLPKGPEAKGDFMCSVRPLEMGELGEVAQCVRLDLVEVLYDDADGQEGQETRRVAKLVSKNQENQKKANNAPQQFPIPDFQFRIDGNKAKFIREPLPGDDSDIKNQEFIKWQIRGNAYQNALLFQGSLNSSLNYQEEEEFKVQSPNDIKLTPKEDEQDQSVDLSQRTPLIETPAKSPVKKISDMQSLVQKKRDWSKGINTYQLFEGKFRNKISDEELKRQIEIEEMRKRQLEDLEEEQTMMGFDQVGGNLNSKKALQNALKDRRQISSISRLKFVMNLAMICLIILAAADYSVIGSSFSEINENFNLIKKSYGRVSEIQRIAFDIRALIMINEGILEPQAKYYISQNNQSLTFESFLKNDLKLALAQLYEYQSALSLSPLSISKKQRHLLYDKSVPMYFKDAGAETVKTLRFTLNEALLQILSAVFTAKHLDLDQFSESENEDLHFININIYRDLLIAMRETSMYYVDDLLERANGEFKTIIILFLISTITLIITLGILFPVVRQVSSARLRILSLFIDIPYSIAIALSAKCEKFIAANVENKQLLEGGQEKTEVATEDLDAGGGGFNSSDDNGLGGEGQKTNKARTPIFQSNNNDNSFFYQFGFATLVLLAYFIAMLVISLQYVSRIQILTQEMNLIAESESYFSFSQNLQRELIYDPNKLIFKGETLFETATDATERLYEFNEISLESHFHHISHLDSNYLKEFDNHQKYNLCLNAYLLKDDIIPFKCEEYIFAVMVSEIDGKFQYRGYKAL